MNDRELLLSVEAAGRQLGIGRSLTWELIRSGELHSVKIGQRRLVPRTEIEAYVERLRAAQDVPV